MIDLNSILSVILVTCPLLRVLCCVVESVLHSVSPFAPAPGSSVVIIVLLLVGKVV